MCSAFGKNNFLKFFSPSLIIKFNSATGNNNLDRGQQNEIQYDHPENVSQTRVSVENGVYSDESQTNVHVAQVHHANTQNQHLQNMSRTSPFSEYNEIGDNISHSGTAKDLLDGINEETTTSSPVRCSSMSSTRSSTSSLSRSLSLYSLMKDSALPEEIQENSHLFHQRQMLGGSACVPRIEYLTDTSSNKSMDISDDQVNTNENENTEEQRLYCQL